MNESYHALSPVEPLAWCPRCGSVVVAGRVGDHDLHHTNIDRLAGTLTEFLAGLSGEIDAGTTASG